MNYQSDRHLPLIDTPWDAHLAQQTIDAIVEQTLAHYDPQTLWPVHPEEDDTGTSNKTFYFGATGVLWALLHLKRTGDLKALEVIQHIKSLYEEHPDTGRKEASYFIGQVGIELLHYKLSGDEQTRQNLFYLIEDNIPNPCMDMLWGAPGTMLPAYFLVQWTKSPLWQDLYKRNVERLLASWKKDDEKDLWCWEYRRGEAVVPYVGAGHGFFGNIFPLLKGLSYLTSQQKNEVLERTSATLKRLAKIEAHGTNWPATFSGNASDTFLVQWCHGAPGIIQCMSPFPRDFDAEVEHLLVQAGEMIWHAGPLSKGIGLCHGTDGNGMSLLKLYERSGDPLWLERARAFAMHAITQRNGRYSLWTGELGLACFLQACLTEKAIFPGLDSF